MSSSGGGAREVGTVTAGMAVMNFDEKTRPYTRRDFIDFLQNYETNLNETEKRLIEKGMLATFLGVPGAFTIGYILSGRLGWHRIVRALDPPTSPTPPPTNNNNPNTNATANHLNTNSMGKAGKAGTPAAPYTAQVKKRPWWITKVPTAGRICFGLAAASIPYVLIQQWFVGAVLDLSEKDSALSFHLRRLMLAQRSGMMFQRTATREVTKEEQNRLMKEAEEHVAENRSGKRHAAGLGSGPVDINLQLSGQALTPVAQSGFKPMPDGKK